MGGIAFLALLMIAGPLMALEWTRLAGPEGSAATEQIALTIGLVVYLLTMGAGDSGLAFALLLAILGLTLAGACGLICLLLARLSVSPMSAVRLPPSHGCGVTVTWDA